MHKLYRTISCYVIRLWLVPRAEGTLVPVPVLILEWINDHLDKCSRCKIELRGLRLTTFALRKAATHSPRKSFDPKFADRVIERVRQGEARQKRTRDQIRIVVAGVTAITVFTVFLVSLGGINLLRAEWSADKKPILIRPLVAVPVSPFAQHDPFATPPGFVKLTFNHIQSSPLLPAKAVPATEGRRPIPDLLSQLWLSRHQTTLALLTPAPIAQHSLTTVPALVPASYNMEDKVTPPVMLASKSNQTGLSVVMPSPSVPSMIGPSAPNESQLNGAVQVQNANRIPTAANLSPYLSNASTTNPQRLYVLGLNESAHSK